MYHVTIFFYSAHFQNMNKNGYRATLIHVYNMFTRSACKNNKFLLKHKQCQVK